MKNIIQIGSILFCFLLFVVTGCDDDPTPDVSADAEADADVEDEHEVEAELCEHAADDDSAVAVTLVDSADDENIASVAVEHARVDLTFSSSFTDGSGGYAEFEADEDGDFLFALTADVPLVVVGESGDVMPEETELGIEACTEIAVIHTFELEVGTHVLRFGPTTETSVGFLFEEAGTHDHEHEE